MQYSLVVIELINRLKNSFLVFSLILEELFKTLDTVDFDTPAIFATSLIVGTSSICIYLTINYNLIGNQFHKNIIFIGKKVILRRILFNNIDINYNNYRIYLRIVIY